ncbi:MAG: ABC-type transport auxiliary lipoprotein family protein [Rhodospirillales bacterium]|jgi:cholesterol transport system auxiliary component|tara:strand:+ start:1458 stop:2075 length:618 start_codon:yes stop_codon:yes gene_type:complete
MGITMIRILNLNLIFASIGFLTACGSAPPVPEDQYYRLQAIYASEPLTTKPLAGTIEVDRFVADGLTSERAIVYSDIQKPNQVRAYHYDFWIKPPTVMLRDELVSFLRKSKISDAVVTPEMRVNAEYALTGKIKHLEQVKMESGYRTILEVELGLRHPNTGKLLFLDTYRLENDASGSSVGAAVKSLNTALSIIYSEFLTSISKL